MLGTETTPFYGRADDDAFARGSEIAPPPVTGAHVTPWDSPVIPRSLQTAYDAVVAYVMPLFGTPHAEFEFRAGRLTSAGHFVPGVPRTEFENIFTNLIHFQSWDHVTPWCPMLDIYRSDGVRRTEFAPPESDQQNAANGVRMDPPEAPQPPVHVRKSQLVDLDFATIGAPSGQAGTQQQQSGLRASLRREEPVDPSTLGQAYELSVRIKRRMSFIHGCCRYDLSCIWSGSTVKAAGNAQPTHEIEIEVDLEKARAYGNPYAALVGLMRATHVLDVPSLELLAVHREDAAFAPQAHPPTTNVTGL